MKKLITLLATVMIFVSANAATYSFSFKNTPVSEALIRFNKEFSDIYINFIHNELSKYRTSANIDTDDACQAIKQIVGQNPITVIKNGNTFYIEALQHGKYEYRGRVVGHDNNPVAAATIMLLNPNDSIVLTYGITDDNGAFAIPCDKSEVIAKITCLGYKPLSRKLSDFTVGIIRMEQLPIELKGVKVDADNTLLYSDRAVFIPTSRQKSASQNAIDLLRHMAIPQLFINPSTGAVTDNGGSAVKIFFNYMSATKEDIEGLRTADVRRVEFLEFPSDPRFRGAQRVVHFIVQEYEYGGYTKFTTSENFPAGLVGRLNAFSKFSFKNLTYDFYVGGNVYDSRHSGEYAASSYSLKDVDGNGYTVNREETLSASRVKQSDFPLTFRTTYNTKQFQMRNMVAFTHKDNSSNLRKGELTYSEYPEMSYTYHRSNPRRYNYLSYSGAFFFVFPHQMSLNVAPRFSYTHNNDYSSYVASNLTDIKRSASEDIYNYRVNTIIQKQIDKNNSISFEVDGGDNVNRLRYTGASDCNSLYHNALLTGEIGYNFKTRNISLNTDAGVCWERVGINGIKQNDIYPYTHIWLSFSPNSKNKLSTYFQFASNTPGISFKSSDVLQSNEFMYITGNPYLKNSRHITFNLSYSWIPTKQLSANVFSNYFKLFNRFFVDYSLFDGAHALLRSYTNDGSYVNYKTGIAVSWKLLNGDLHLYARPQFLVYKTTGSYRKSLYQFDTSIQATYYLGNVYLQAYYNSPDKWINATAPQTVWGYDSHSLSAGWSRDEWNINVSAFNFFNNGWVDQKVVTESKYYVEHRTAVSRTPHLRFNVAVTYTFGYGKKVKRENEVGEQSDGAPSAIIK